MTVNQDLFMGIYVGGFFLLLGIILHWRKKKLPADFLDAVLYWWVPGRDAWTVRDLLRSIVIVGQSGSGKSSSSGYQLAKAIVGHGNTGGLILASKPEDLAFWKKIFAQAGRSGDLLIFGPNSSLRCNVLDFEQQAGAEAMDVVKMIFVLAETLTGGEQASSQEAMFWAQQSQQQLFCAVLACKLAYGKVSAPDLLRFLTTAATSPLLFTDEKDIPEENTALRAAAMNWRAGFHNQTLAKAFAAQKSPIEAQDFEQVLDFWTKVYPNRDGKLRSSVDAQIVGVLHVMCTGIVRELLSTTTTVSPADMEGRKFIFVDMPPAGKGLAEAFCLAALKFITQRHILRRAAKPGDPILVIHSDECQKVINSADADFLAMCRSHLGCMFFLTQSLHSFGANMRGQSGEHKAEELLTNYGTKVFHVCGDSKTAEWASGLLGQVRETFISNSIAPPEDLYDELFSGKQRITTSISQDYKPVLQPNAFLAGLRAGGKANGLMADAIIIRVGEPFAWGRNYIKVAFSQK